MFRKVPVIGHPIGLGDLFFALLRRNAKSGFQEALKIFFGAPYVFLTNTGISSFYLILMSLKKVSRKTEVILPCYTAPSLVVAVKKAGLTPVLCDISLKDFNADTQGLLRRVNVNTLCVVIVHMFGIPFGDIGGLRNRIPADCFIVEDCAQAFGSRIDGKDVGTFGDFNFCSFNRGKNLPTYDGGCAITRDRELALEFEAQMLKFPGPNIRHRLVFAMKLFALLFAFRPLCYGLFYFLIRHFKDNTVPADFEVVRATSFQAGVGQALLKRSRDCFEKRCCNGEYLIKALKEVKSIILPDIAGTFRPAFNRLPVIFENENELEKAAALLERKGIESSRLYLKPLHHIFDLGYEKDEFPNAVHLAGHLLTLPVHPLVTERDLETMVRVIKDTVDSRS
jgi:dTDP-4-amino-4,6-dideoxygalactose transaminase